VIRSLICVVALASALAISVAHAEDSANPIVGDYLCMSGGTCPCEKDVVLQVQAHGKWQYGSFAGTYRATDSKVDFEGSGAAATWGPATIGSSSLTFYTGSNPIVCWLAPKSGRRIFITPKP
jgi:hypothetical protein